MGGAKVCQHGIAGVSINGLDVEEFIKLLSQSALKLSRECSGVNKRGTGSAFQVAHAPVRT